MSEIAEAFVRVRPDTSTFRAEATAGIQSGLAGAGAAVAPALGKNLLLAGGAIAGVTTATMALQVAIDEVVFGTGRFEQNLDVLAATADASSSEIQQVSDLAKELGADITLPGISAGDAAQTITTLSKAGLTLRDSMDGARGSLQLAAAAEIEVAQASNIIAGALNTFQLEGTEATHVADLLAGASIAAQGEVSDMALALQQAGPVAKLFGLSLEETVGAVTVLARAGLRGSDLGTSFKSFLTKLVPQSDEAAKFQRALGIELDNTISVGEQLPQVVDQYRAALEKLTPIEQQAALTTIFGSDAIRAAGIIFAEGSQGLEDATAAADRNGAANELATAKTQGLIGAVEGLKSTLSTLAIEVGEVLNPAIEDFLRDLTDGASAVTNFVREVKELGDVELPDWLDPTDTSIGEALGDGLRGLKRDLANTIPVIGFLGDAADALGQMPDKVESVVRDSIRVQDVQAEAAQQGQAVGQALGGGIAQGVQSTTALAVEAARANLAQVVAAGREAVAASIAGAQQNLAGLGAQLAADAGEIIDANGVADQVNQAQQGVARAQSAAQTRRQQEAIKDAKAELDRAIANAPIQREIRRLQEELDQENRRDDRTDVARSLRDAKEALADARRQAQTAGPLDARQVSSRQRFLRPFIEDVQDAKKEVSRFNKESTIASLQKKIDSQTDEITENIENLRDALDSARESLISSQQSFSTGGVAASLKSAGEEQKAAVKRGIADAIQAFNDGLITLPQLNRRLAKVLEENGVDYKNAGSKLGTAFLRGFEETLEGIGTQAEEVLKGPQKPGAGLEAKIVSPAKTAADVAIQVRQAQTELDRALIRNGEYTNQLLESINRKIGGTTPVRPVTSVAQESGRRGSSGRGPVP